MDTEKTHVKGLSLGVYKDFTWLYDLYASRLYSFIFNMVRSESIAKDIVQETFIKVWLCRERINPDLSFKSYLFTIAKNRLISELKNQMSTSDEIESLDNSLYEDCSVEKEIALKEFRQNLEKAKLKLTERQRELFELNKEQGLSVSEIAIQTSISEQSVRNHLYNAIQLLRKEMKPFYSLFLLFF